MECTFSSLTNCTYWWPISATIVVAVQTIAPQLRGCFPVASGNILYMDFVLVMVFETSEYLYLPAGGVTASHMLGLVVLGLTLVKMIHACTHIYVSNGSRDADIRSHHSPRDDVLQDSPYDIALP